MSARVKICQIVPTTFHGISIGSAITTNAVHRPAASRQAQRDRDAERHLDHEGDEREGEGAKQRVVEAGADFRLGFSRSRNQASPFQKKLFAPMVSWIE